MLNQIYAILAILIHVGLVVLVIYTYIQMKNTMIDRYNVPTKKGWLGIGKNLGGLNVK